MPTLVLSDTWQLPFARGDENHKMLPHVTCGLLHHLSETQTPLIWGVREHGSFVVTCFFDLIQAFGWMGYPWTLPLGFTS